MKINFKGLGLKGLAGKLPVAWIILGGALAFGIPIAALAYLVLTDLMNQVRVTQKELRGIDLIKPLFEVEKALQEHRAVISVLKVDDPSIQKQLKEEANEANRL